MVFKKAVPGYCSILLVSVWVVDELPIQLLCLLRIELLTTAFNALKSGTNNYHSKEGEARLPSQEKCVMVINSRIQKQSGYKA